MLTSAIKKIISYLSNTKAIAVLWTFLVLAACIWPGKDIPSEPMPGFDKIVHTGLFTIWTVLWLLRYPGKSTRIIVTGILYGFFLEVLQHLLPVNRTFDLTDLLADSAGILVGFILYRYVVITYLQRLY